MIIVYFSTNITIIHNQAPILLSLFLLNPSNNSNQTITKEINCKYQIKYRC